MIALFSSALCTLPVLLLLVEEVQRYNGVGAVSVSEPAVEFEWTRVSWGGTGKRNKSTWQEKTWRDCPQLWRRHFSQWKTSTYRFQLSHCSVAGNFTFFELYLDKHKRLFGVTQFDLAARRSNPGRESSSASLNSCSGCRLVSGFREVKRLQTGFQPKEYQRGFLFTHQQFSTEASEMNCLCIYLVEPIRNLSTATWVSVSSMIYSEMSRSLSISPFLTFNASTNIQKACV